MVDKNWDLLSIYHGVVAALAVVDGVSWYEQVKSHYTCGVQCRWSRLKIERTEYCVASIELGVNDDREETTVKEIEIL